jgi:hypothetical protein
MWFGKAVQDFNTSIMVQGQQAPELVAEAGNAFTSRFSAVFTLSSINRLDSGLGCVRVLRGTYHHLPGETECQTRKGLISMLCAKIVILTTLASKICGWVIERTCWLACTSTV